MLLLVAIVAVAAMWTARRYRGDHFVPLLLLLLMGLNGAFITADLFNLFVFFEILLIASYALLLHGNGRARVAAGLHYVVLNLFGSALFLIALGVLYGVAGTLNMADLAHKVALANADQRPLLAAAGLLLLVVFGLKAALLPLYFWLPRAYSAATAPVAAPPERTVRTAAPARNDAADNPASASPSQPMPNPQADMPKIVSVGPGSTSFPRWKNAVSCETRAAWAIECVTMTIQ